MTEENQSTTPERPRLRAIWKQHRVEKESNMLIGKVLTGKNLTKKAIISTIRKGWNLGEDTDVTEMSNNTFVFTFKKMKERERVLRGRPWTVLGALMSIQLWDEYKIPQEACFEKNPLWVQFHNLPLGLLEEETNIQNMGSLVGDLLWYEKPKVRGKFTRSFGRARVLVDVNQPLVTGFMVERPDGSDVWVDVKYERLCPFCYKCGIIGHDFKGCNKSVTMDDKGKRVYGAWLLTNSEKDIDEALIKFSDTWVEEDCRSSTPAREEVSPEEREEGDHKAICCSDMELSEPTSATQKVSTEKV